MNPVLKRIGIVVTAPIWFPSAVALGSFILALFLVLSFTVFPLIKTGNYLINGTFKVEGLDDLCEMLDEPEFLLVCLAALCIWGMVICGVLARFGFIH